MRDVSRPANAGAAMATILSFKAAERSLPSSLKQGLGGEIVLFPGVRYEYHAAHHDPEPSKPKRKADRKRDKLILQD